MSVEYYNKNAEDFFKATVEVNMSRIYSIFEKYLEKGKILDLGCGSGRDSKYFLKKGYEVVALDYSHILAKKASEYIGQNVIIEDMRNINFKNEFDGIWACASLLHLEKNELIKTLKKCYDALKIGGVLYTSFKYREQDYQEEERYFTCFNEEKILEVIKKLKFNCEMIFLTQDVRPNKIEEQWINIILKK